jgi:hypothetical protein
MTSSTSNDLVIGGYSKFDKIMKIDGSGINKVNGRYK